MKNLLISFMVYFLLVGILLSLTSFSSGIKKTKVKSLNSCSFAFAKHKVHFKGLQPNLHHVCGKNNM